MTKNNQWEVLEWNTAVQGCIAGQVTDKVTGQPIAGAWVQIGPKGEDLIFNDWLRLQEMRYGERWELMLVRPDRTLSGADGRYHFVGLPEGANCTLTASLPSAGHRYADAEPLDVSITLALDYKSLSSNLKLRPTTISGTVSVATTEGLEIVEVGIEKCDAHAFSRLYSNGAGAQKQGKFLLVGLEPWSESTTYSVEFSVKGKIGKTVEVQGLLRGECRDLGIIELVLT